MEETNPGSSSPTTFTSTMLLSSSARLLRFSQEDIAQIAAVVAGLIQPPPSTEAELSSSSSSANPLQVVSGLLSSAVSNSSLAYLAVFNNTSVTPSVIETLDKIYWGVERHIPSLI